MSVVAQNELAAARRTGGGREWTFLSSHAAVLLHVARHRSDSFRSIAAATGLSERTAAQIIADLRAAGYIRVQRRGRHNYYTLNRSMPLRRTGYTDLKVRHLLDALRVAAR